MAIESDIPNNTAPTIVHGGLPRDSIAITIAMKPAPWVMNGVKVPAPTSARYAPPSPANAPAHNVARVRVVVTLTPAASSASGRSPAALMLSPAEVRRSTHPTTKASAIPM